MFRKSVPRMRKTEIGHVSSHSRRARAGGPGLFSALPSRHMGCRASKSTTLDPSSVYKSSRAEHGKLTRLAALAFLAVGCGRTTGGEFGPAAASVGSVLDPDGHTATLLEPAAWPGVPTSSTPWSAVHATDPQTLIVFLTGPPPASVCNPVAGVTVTADATRVAITIRIEAPPGIFCELRGAPDAVRVRLDAPLNGREVVDGATGSVHPLQ